MRLAGLADRVNGVCHISVVESHLRTHASEHRTRQPYSWVFSDVSLSQERSSAMRISVSLVASSPQIIGLIVPPRFRWVAKSHWAFRYESHFSSASFKECNQLPSAPSVVKGASLSSKVLTLARISESNCFNSSSFFLRLSPAAMFISVCVKGTIPNLSKVSTSSSAFVNRIA
jgi:hypothetical protein